MRLYNAVSCTPMGTSSAFGTRKSSSFLPSAEPKAAPWKSVRLRKINSDFVTATVSKPTILESPPGIQATSTNSTDALTATPSVVSEDEIETIISEKFPALRSLEELLQSAMVVNVESEDTGTISTFSTRCSVSYVDQQQPANAPSVRPSQDEDFSAMFDEEFASPLPQVAGVHREPWPSCAEIQDEPLGTPPSSNDATELRRNEKGTHRKVSPVKALFPESPTKVLFDDFRSVKLRRVTGNTKEQSKSPDSVVLDQQRAPQDIPVRLSQLESPATSGQLSTHEKKLSEFAPGAGKPAKTQHTQRGGWNWTEAKSKAETAAVAEVSPSSAASPVIRSFRSPFDLPKPLKPSICLTSSRESLVQHETNQTFRAGGMGERALDDLVQAAPVVTVERVTERPAPLAVSSLFDEIKSRRRMSPRPLRAIPQDIPRSVVIKSSMVPAAKPQNASGLDDDAYVKYKDMLKKGVPAGAVQNAMIRDGVDPCGLDLGINSPPQQAPPHPAVKDKYRRTRLHWQAHDGIKSNTIWGMVERDPELTNLKVDEREFQSLFRSETGVPEKPRTVLASTLSKVHAIDPKRANNGGIILSRLKMPYDRIARAVDTFDYHAFTSEQIRGILPFVATPEEEKALGDVFHGRDRVSFHSLCECEKFMVTMMNVQYPKRKLEAILFMHNFTSSLEEIRRGSEVITEACKEVIGSSRLRKVLGVILELGNRLNTAGSRRSRARAITLESLPKLKQAKAFDKKTTFLHFVVKVVRENNGHLIHFKDDISTVFKAEKVQLEQLEAECHKLTRVLEEVRKFVLHLSGEYPRSVIHDGQILLNSSFSLGKDVEIQNKSMVGRFCLNGCMRLNAVVNEVAKAKEQVDDLLRYFGEETYEGNAPMCTIASFTREFESAVDDVIREEKLKRWSLFLIDEGTSWYQEDTIGG